MRLRPFKKCDADTIISWIQNERIFRFWCADRFESYPITGEDLIAQYEDLAYNDDIFHFVAYDESGLIGHFNIRYPNKDDIDTVRLGYVIVDDKRRGQGLGKKMIKMALDYAVSYMHASKVTIGVFDNNPSALNCYLKAGFEDTGITELYSCMGEDWTCKELIYYPSVITPEEYISMREAVCWSSIPVEEARAGLSDSYVYCIREVGRPVALGRLVRDNGYVVYIADVIVLPEYQGKGYGTKIMNKLLSVIRESIIPEGKVMISLLAAQGKEGFYEKFGFDKRPNEHYGCGMHKWIKYGE
ncbi:MAG: GNAT family N-acetyltransferase [Saccharofermentans sp.]|nr:GNAT family N-acetyltransferase [Saccharofermentans sp.]